MNDWSGFYIMIAILCVFFYRDPDIADAIVYFLMQE